MPSLFENLAPERFSFWLPPEGSTVPVGPEQRTVLLPTIPLPLHRIDAANAQPTSAAIGQGTCDYLRQFPNCQGNGIYAALLRDAYPHFIADMASYAVMIDAKQVESPYVLRKLNCLKVLILLEPENRGLLLQLCRGFFELSLEFSELSACRQHLLEALRYGQDLLRVNHNDAEALALVAEIDLLFGDTPGAADKWRRLLFLGEEPDLTARIEARIAACNGVVLPESCLVDDLEAVAEAMHLHTLGDHSQAVFILERLEEDGRLTSALPSADFYWLLGICRRSHGDVGGACAALMKAMELEPDHAAAMAALESL